MGKFWQTSEFNALQREWNERLRDSGFVDAELEGECERFLKNSAYDSHREKFNRPERTELFVESSYQYFQTLSELAVTEKEYDDEYDRLIMERTAEGKTIREISDELRSLIPDGRRRTKLNRYTIMFVRRRYENRWGIRSWTPEQMRRKARTK